jgi:hypothetical protein
MYRLAYVSEPWLFAAEMRMDSIPFADLPKSYLETTQTMLDKRFIPHELCSLFFIVRMQIVTPWSTSAPSLMNGPERNICLHAVPYRSNLQVRELASPLERRPDS